MKKLPRKYRDPLIFLGLLIAVPSFIYFISMNFGDQRVHIEKKQWNPAEPEDQGFDPQHLKKVAEYIETRLPMARGMVIIRNGRTVHEKYYWRGGPREKDYLHSLNRAILYGLVGIAMEKRLLSGPDQQLTDFFPDHAAAAGSLTVGDLLKVRAPLTWGRGAPAYWDLFFSGDRVGDSLKAISGEAGAAGPTTNFAANFLLTEVIRRAASMDVFEFADNFLFTPMGIDTLKENGNSGGLMDPFIGFQLRTLDLAKFGYMVMNRGNWEGSSILPEDWAARINEMSDDEGFRGGWEPVTFNTRQAIMAAGEGGQYILLCPALDLLVTVSSKSTFPLSGNSGYRHLFQLILEAADEQLARSEPIDPDERSYYEPNFVSATEVPDEIRQFFLDFSRDIATQDINRILYHYAKGYETKDANIGWLDDLFLKDEDYQSRYGFWQEIFYGGTGDLEFVQIEKIRIDGNRAYLRGALKYSYANMNKGSIGWFTLENLIKLRGRWLWFGKPAHAAILDRDEYFDAEVSEDLGRFIDECGKAIAGISSKKRAACFVQGFMHNGLEQDSMQELLKPYWHGADQAKMHVTGAEQKVDSAVVEGYFTNSLIGTISLPPGMKVVRSGSFWQWSGNGLQ
ncbi:MAG: hypothetical protein AMJ61_09545 [Desulfobacterales bacterium SG8_35_2]|nr:MAG: hypothetical protein AMJ61_09545 [Desulfobacterales bacterium SG8_35_2]